MAAPSWPSTLPQRPQSDGYERRPKSSVIAFETEVGPGKRRRRSSVRMMLVSATFRIDGSQLSTFETFFRSTLADGTLVFQWADPVDGGSYLWQFDKSEPYRVSNKGADIYDVSCRLERLS